MNSNSRQTLRSSFFAGILLFLLACSFGQRAPSAQQPAASSDQTGAGSQVAITGAVNTTYTANNVSAVLVGDQAGIVVDESESNLCGVELQFPLDTAPGSYAFEDDIQNPVAKIWADYSGDCGATGFYVSTGGTLTLTSVAPSFSGTFDFTAAKRDNPSDSIHVVGSFNNAALP